MPAHVHTHARTHTHTHGSVTALLLFLLLQVRQLMAKMDMDHDGNVGGDEFLATLIDWGQVGGVWRQLCAMADVQAGGCCLRLLMR